MLLLASDLFYTAFPPFPTFFSILFKKVYHQSQYTCLPHMYAFNPFPNDKILDSSKLGEFSDNNFKFDENGRMFFKRVENTVGKGEIARYEQFLLFSQCFQKTCTADT